MITDVKTPYKVFGNTTIKDEEGKDVTVPLLVNPKTGQREHDPKK